MVHSNLKPMLAVAVAVGLTVAGVGLTHAQTQLASMSGVEWLNHIERLQKGGGSGAPERPWVAAEVRKVDPRASEMTIAHGAIPSIDMPAMTMTFPVQDAAHLRMLKSGDRVEVQAANVGGTVKIVNVRMRH